jgi:hypothetical protein
VAPPVVVVDPPVDVPPDGFVGVGVVGVGDETGCVVAAFTTRTPLPPAFAFPATESRNSKRPLASVTVSDATLPGKRTGVPFPGQELALRPFELEQITKRCGFLPGFCTLKTTAGGERSDQAGTGHRRDSDPTSRHANDYCLAGSFGFRC